MNTFFTFLKAFAISCSFVFLISCDFGVVGFPTDPPIINIYREDWVVNKSQHEITIKSWMDSVFYREIYISADDTVVIPGKINMTYLEFFGEPQDSTSHLWNDLFNVPIATWDSAEVVFEDGHSYFLRNTDSVGYNFLIDENYLLLESDTLFGILQEYWFEFTEEDYLRAK